ncbi:MAG: TniB family NTP-binding protein [Burkholderiales bacterium]
MTRSLIPQSLFVVGEPREPLLVGELRKPLRTHVHVACRASRGARQHCETRAFCRNRSVGVQSTRRRPAEATTLVRRVTKRGDNAHHLHVGTVREQRQSLNQLEFLSNELRMPVIAPGTSKALYATQADPQIASRFEPIALPGWRESAGLREFVVSFGRRA